jgi:hypothetical protein
MHFALVAADGKQYRISKTNSSCGCLELGQFSKDIGSRPTVMPLTFHANGAIGKIEQSVRLLQSDNADDLLDLTVRATCRGCAASRSAVDFGHISTASGRSLSTTVFCAGYDQLPELDVRSADRKLSIALHEAVTEKSDSDRGLRAVKRIELTWDTKGLALGQHWSKLHISALAPASWSVELPVSMYLAGNATIRPSILFFGQLAGSSASTSRKCEIDLDPEMCRGDEAIHIRSDHPAITVRGSWEGGATRRIICEAEVDCSKLGDADVSQVIRGNLAGSLGDKAESVFSVPYIAFRKKEVAR